MRDKEKAALAVGGIGLVGLLTYLATRAKAVPEGPAAAVKIEVLDAEGNPVPANSPLTLDEGASYTVKTTVTNNTTRGGKPWEADLEAWITAGLNLTELIDQVFPSHYLPGSIGYFYSPFTVPMGLGGKTGAIVANVFDPDNNLLDSAIIMISIRSMAIVYGATVTVEV